MNWIELILLGLLIIALAGWAACLILFARSILPMMNGLAVMFKVDDLFDKRINAVLDRARANTKKPVVPDGKPTPQDQAAKIQEDLRGMFGGGPLISPAMGLDEQPDPALEVVRA